MESVLVARAKNGDRAAFDRLADRYRARLMTYCLHFLRAAPEAEDAVQETFVLSWKHLSTFHEESSFSTWLFRIARNHCLNRLRRKGQELSLEQIGPRSGAPTISHVSIVEAQFYSRQVVADVMDRLDQRDCIILWWHFQEAMTSEEISRRLPTEMKLSDDGVRSRLKRHIRPAIEAVRILHEL